MKTISLRLPDDLHTALMKHSKDTDRTVSEIVSDAIRSHIQIQGQEHIMIERLTAELMKFNADKSMLVRKYIGLGMSKDAANRAWEKAHE